jgi:hypothetical protein
MEKHGSLGTAVLESLPCEPDRNLKRRVGPKVKSAWVISAVSVGSLVSLALLGIMGAMAACDHTGNPKGCFGGALAMAGP